jgi:hypothetical protein
VEHWIAIWNNSYEDFKRGYQSAHDSHKLIIREKALERMLLSSHKSPADYAQSLADWAATAGAFPDHTIISPISRMRVKCSDYWKELIVRAAKEEIGLILAGDQTKQDLTKLIEFCELNIPIGTLHANKLLSVLRSIKDKQKNFLGMGDMDVKSGYQFVDINDDSQPSAVEEAQLVASAQAAPEHEPKIEEYPNKLAFMKAKMRWEQAIKRGLRS